VTPLVYDGAVKARGRGPIAPEQPYRQISTRRKSAAFDHLSAAAAAAAGP